MFSSAVTNRAVWAGPLAQQSPIHPDEILSRNDLQTSSRGLTEWGCPRLGALLRRVGGDGRRAAIRGGAASRKWVHFRTIGEGAGDCSGRF